MTRTINEIQANYQDAVDIRGSLLERQLAAAMLVTDIPDLLDALNTAQCAYAFEADSLSYETKRFREALAEKDEEIDYLKAELTQFHSATEKLSRGIWKVC